jgi:hypothetical protein
MVTSIPITSTYKVANANHRLEKWITSVLVEKNKRITLTAAKKTIQELEE